MSSRLASVTHEKLTGEKDGTAEIGNGESETAGGPKEEKKEEKKLFDPQSSAAMAKIAQVGTFFVEILWTFELISN